MKIRILLSKLLLVCVLISCNNSKPTSVINYNNIIKENVVNDSLVEELAYNIQESYLEKDLDLALSYFDMDAFGKLVINKTKNDNSLTKMNKGFLKGIKIGLKALPKNIINEVKNGHYYDFVSYSYDTKKETYTILFRLYSPETGINYHSYRVSKTDKGLVYNDIYVYASGEYLSESMERLYYLAIPKKNLFNVFGKGKVEDLYKITNATKLYQNGKYEEAHILMKTVSKEVSNDRYYLIINSTIASEINDKMYEKSIKKIIEKFPNDASLYLNHIDYYILKRNYDKAIEIINIIEDQTGDDFIALLKGNIELEREDVEKASLYYKIVSDNYPDFFIGHSSYLFTLVKLNKVNESINFLNKLINLEFNKQDLIDYIEEVDENGFNDFDLYIQTSQYKKWKANKNT